MALLLVMTMGAVGCAPILGIEDTVFEGAGGGGDSCALVTERIFFGDKVVTDTSVTIGVVTKSRFDEIATLLGTTIDPQRGHVMATMTDCSGALVEDAALSIEPPPSDITAFVVGESGLSLGADTSSLGLVGALNLTAPTEVALEAYPDELGNDFSSSGDVETAAGEIGYIVLSPNSETNVPATIPPAGPPDFSCVGNIPSPMSMEMTATITVNIRLSETLAPLGQPLSGVRVRVCRDAMEACIIDLSKSVDPVNEAETDSTGAAMLIVATPSDGFDGSLLVVGRVPGCT